jgi:hypothetical protein
LIFCFAVANYFAFSASFTLISLGFLLFLLAKSGSARFHPQKSDSGRARRRFFDFFTVNGRQSEICDL